VLLLTESANNSPHVLSELELAFNERKPILPVLVAGVVPSENVKYFISTSQWFDAEGAFDDDDIARLRTHVEKLLAGEEVRIEHEKKQSRVVWIAIAVLLIGGLTAAVYLMRSRSVPAPPPGVGPTARETPTSKPATPTPAKEEVTSSRVNPRDGQTYVWIPPGRFSMGCSPGDSRCEPDEMPAHLVRVDKGFWLERTEVTVAQWAAARREVPFKEDQKDTNEPVVGVPWQEAKDYCASMGGRLPTEAEWEYAARAGVTTSYYDTVGSIAWYQENSDDRAHAVGQKLPNAFGLHDMLGNAYEWVRDRYFNQYDESDEGPIDEPLASNAYATARGGAWTSPAKDVRVSNRFGIPPDATEPNIGFRCAMDEK
jgi:formylglycine-generating enzyme required for sulfatase activity